MVKFVCLWLSAEPFWLGALLLSGVHLAPHLNAVSRALCNTAERPGPRRIRRAVSRAPTGAGRTLVPPVPILLPSFGGVVSKPVALDLRQQNRLVLTELNPHQLGEMSH